MRQLLRVYKLTLKSDKPAKWWALLAFFGPLVGIVVLAGFVNAWEFWGTLVWGISGTLTGVLATMITLSRRAERLAYQQIEGQVGAVGAVLSNGLRGGWRSSEMPVAVNPRSRDAIYRAVGPGGVVLIAEGSRGGVQKLLEEEKRKVARVAPGAPVNFLFVTGDENATRLHELRKALKSHKRALNRAEVSVVYSRLQSLGNQLPIPKGIDPTKLRPVRK